MMYVFETLPLLYDDGAYFACRPVLLTMTPFYEYLSILTKIGSPRFRRFIVDHLPFKNAKRLRDIVDTMYETSIVILQAKERALQEGGEAVMKQIGKGQDVISILSTCILMFDLDLFIDFLHSISESKHESIR